MRRAEAEPWQLRLFQKSLKKKQKLRLLLRLLGPLAGQRCLLLTHGDNNGALNHRFRLAGGRWTWADLGGEGLQEMARFLGEPVHYLHADALPFRTGAFQRVLVIDVHEHLQDFQMFNRELARVLRPNGLVVVTVPNGDPKLPLAQLKRWIGMDPAVYGHVVQGYSPTELKSMLRAVDLMPESEGAYSKCFTEAIELAINFAYVKVLGHRGRGQELPRGVIAPNTERRLRAMKGSYRVYSFAYPLIVACSSLDVLIPGGGGYAVAVAARKRG